MCEDNHSQAMCDDKSCVAACGPNDWIMNHVLYSKSNLEHKECLIQFAQKHSKSVAFNGIEHATQLNILGRGNVFNEIGDDNFAIEAIKYDSKLIAVLPQTEVNCRLAVNYHEDAIFYIDKLSWPIVLKAFIQNHDCFLHICNKSRFFGNLIAQMMRSTPMGKDYYAFLFSPTNFEIYQANLLDLIRYNGELFNRFPDKFHLTSIKLRNFDQSFKLKDFLDAIGLSRNSVIENKFFNNSEIYEILSSVLSHDPDLIGWIEMDILMSYPKDMIMLLLLKSPEKRVSSLSFNKISAILSTLRENNYEVDEISYNKIFLPVFDSDAKDPWVYFNHYLDCLRTNDELSYGKESFFLEFMYRHPTRVISLVSSLNESVHKSNGKTAKKLYSYAMTINESSLKFIPYEHHTVCNADQLTFKQSNVVKHLYFFKDEYLKTAKDINFVIKLAKRAIKNNASNIMEFKELASTQACWLTGSNELKNLYVELIKSASSSNFEDFFDFLDDPQEFKLKYMELIEWSPNPDDKVIETLIKHGVEFTEIENTILVANQPKLFNYLKQPNAICIDIAIRYGVLTHEQFKELVSGYKPKFIEKSKYCKLKFKKDPSYDDIHAAIKLNPAAIDLVENQPPQLTTLAIQLDSSLIRYIKKPERRIIGYSLEPSLSNSTYENFKYLYQNTDFLDDKLIKFAVKNDKRCISLIETEMNLNPIEAIDWVKHGYKLKYIKNQTRELCILAIMRDYNEFDSIVLTNKNDFYTLAVSRGYPLERVTQIDFRIANAAIGYDPTNLRYINQQTLELCLLAVRANFEAIKYVKDEKMLAYIAKVLIKQG